jgi:hypothetical protein
MSDAETRLIDLLQRFGKDRGNPPKLELMANQKYTPEVLRTFVVIPSDVYLEMPEMELNGSTVLQGTIHTFKTKYLLGVYFLNKWQAGVLYTHEPLGELLFWKRHNPKIDCQIPVAQPKTSRKMPDSHYLNIYLRGWVTSDLALDTKDPIHPVLGILPFNYLKTFRSRYVYYTSDPDNAVQIITQTTQKEEEYLFKIWAQVNPVVDNFVSEGFQPKYVGEGPDQDVHKGEAVPSIKTRDQIFFAIHMISLSIFKNFTSQDHLIQFIRRRLSAFNSAIGSYEITETNWHTILSVDFLMVVGKTYNMYPKLRAMMFQAVIHCEMPEFSHTKQLLSYVGMTSVHLISAFLSAATKTMAHVHHTILSESINFGVTLKRLEVVYGNSLKYLRLLNATFTDFDINHWPNLNYIATVYACVHMRLTLTQYRTSTAGVTVHGCSRLIATVIPPDFYKGKTAILNVQQLIRDNIDLVKNTLHLDTDLLLNPVAMAGLQDAMEDQVVLTDARAAEQAIRGRAAREGGIGGG